MVDRFRVRPEAAQRLAESFETAIQLGNGIAQVVFPDNAELAPLLFSSRHACPECGFSVPPLEPRMFSFNNPAGACPTCDGLGFQEFFDPERVVVHPHLSLAGGAVRGWDRRNAHYFQMLQSLARHYHFDSKRPGASCPRRVQRSAAVRQRRASRSNSATARASSRDTRRRHAFEGIVPNLERRYRETDSQAVREELAQVPGHARLHRLRRRATERGGALGADRGPQPACDHAADGRAGAATISPR